MSGTNELFNNHFLISDNTYIVKSVRSFPIVIPIKDRAVPSFLLFSLDPFLTPPTHSCLCNVQGPVPLYHSACTEVTHDSNY